MHGYEKQRELTAGLNMSFAWGVGAQAHLGSLGARAEFEQFRTMGNEKLSAISVSVLYTFF